MLVRWSLSSLLLLLQRLLLVVVMVEEEVSSFFFVPFPLLFAQRRRWLVSGIDKAQSSIIAACYP